MLDLHLTTATLSWGITLSHGGLLEQAINRRRTRRTSGVKWPGKTLDCAVHPLFGSRDHTRGIYPMSKYTPELQQRLRTTPWCGFDRGKTAACCRFVDQKCQVLMDAWVAFSEGRSTALKADHGARVAAAATLGAPLRFKPTSGPGWSGAGLWDANVNRLAS
jgi:hypothetical protein